MRTLLALVTFFAVFQAQAYCYITNSAQPQILSSPVIIDLDAGRSSETYNVDLNAPNAPSFACFGAEGGTPNQFALSVTQNSNEYYTIYNGAHKLTLRIWLEAVDPKYSGVFANESYNKANVLNTFKFKLNYSVENAAGVPTLREAKVNENLPLDSHVLIKPMPCEVNNDCESGHNNATHAYIYDVMVIPKFTPTTCTFKDAEVEVPSISYHEIDNPNYLAPKSSQPQLECNSATGVATSNIRYSFSPITPTATSTLVNELGSEPGSAGDVGFILMNNGQVINKYPSPKFTVATWGSTVQNGSKFALDLKFRYARYGNRVVTGRVQSKVKVVVDYD